MRNMNYNEYLNKIIRFNGDKDFLMMREKYNDPSFLRSFPRKGAKQLSRLS